MRGAAVPAVEHEAEVIPLFRDRGVALKPGPALANNPWRRKDIARELGVSVSTVRRWERDHGLEPVRPLGPGGPVCFNPLRVRSWRAAQRPR